MHSKRRKLVLSTSDKLVVSQESVGRVMPDTIGAVQARVLAAGAGSAEVGNEMMIERDNGREVGGAVVIGGSGRRHAVAAEHGIAEAMESENAAVENVAELRKHENKTVEVEEEEEEEEDEEEDEEEEEEEEEEGGNDFREEEDDESVEESSEEEEEEEEHKQAIEKAWKPNGLVTGRIVLSSTGEPVLMDDEGVQDVGAGMANSMEGSRSRSEDGIGAIGGATRIEDTGTSQWKEVDLIDWEDQEQPLGLQSEQERDHHHHHHTPDDVFRVVYTEVADTEAENNGFQAPLSLIDTAVVTEASGDEDGGNNNENLESAVPVAEEEVGTDSDSSITGKEGDGNSSAPTAYSRAFSKIFKSKAPSSELGPVLSARQSLVAQKLDAEAGEHKKDAKKEKKELREKAHVLPQPYTDNKEKDLMKLATRGVVKLFNAVSKAQKVQTAADSRDAKVIAKQSKSAFLSELKSQGPSSVQGTLTTGKGRPLQPTTPLQFATVDSHQRDCPPTSQWSVVQEDFMLGREKLKGWDQNEDFGTLEGQSMIGNQVADGPGVDFSDDEDDDN